jgi:ubiquitin-like protein 4
VRKELVGDVGVDKVKILLKRKPVSGDEKNVGEVLGEDLGDATDVEFGVMIMGGGQAKGQASEAVTPSVGTPAPEEEKADVMEGVEKSQVSAAETARAVQGPVGEEALRMEGFWTDLKGFLVQRLKVDEEMAGKVADRFRGGWEGGGKV